MRQAFTLIELMIVIAIIAIIAAIAIPNLLESRVTANESAAASSLKGGLFPAQVQFQAGGYIDPDGNGRGCYASHASQMAGSIGAGTTTNTCPVKPLHLLDPTWNNCSALVAGDHGVVVATGAAAAGTAPAGAAATGNATRVGQYDYDMLVTVATGGGANDGTAENYWGATAAPIDITGSAGRRMFAINSGGNVTQTKQSVPLNVLTLAAGKALALGLNTGSMFTLSPKTDIGNINGNNAVPYIK
jgi:prepilin-type N-terminal cleavage/methylation domain-containing protein